MIERFGARAIAMVVCIMVLAALILFGVSQCQQKRSASTQSKIDRGQLGASTASGADAVNTTGNVAAGERASEDLTRTNEKEIRDAEGANDPVNPAARDAGLRSLCRRPAYRDSERCRVLQAPAR